jgi:hypothetical protein
MTLPGIILCPLTVQYIAGALCILTAVAGLFLQLAATRYSKHGTPRDSAVGSFYTSTIDFRRSELGLFERQAFRNLAGSVNSLSSTTLFLSVVAGLTVSFWWLWLPAILLTLVPLSIAFRDLLTMRQQWLSDQSALSMAQADFERLPTNAPDP